MREHIIISEGWFAGRYGEGLREDEREDEEEEGRVQAVQNSQ